MVRFLKDETDHLEFMLRGKISRVAHHAGGDSWTPAGKCRLVITELTLVSNRVEPGVNRLAGREIAKDQVHSRERLGLQDGSE